MLDLTTAQKVHSGVCVRVRARALTCGRGAGGAGGQGGQGGRVGGNGALFGASHKLNLGKEARKTKRNNKRIYGQLSALRAWRRRAAAMCPWLRVTIGSSSGSREHLYDTRI